MKCIYCESAEANSKEHIIQSALGSNLKSSIILCASCNNYFSTKESGYVDQSIVNAFSAFRNFFSIWGDRNTPPPILKNIGTKSGKKYDIAPGLVPFIPGSIRSEKNNNDGTFEINISSQNEEKAREQLSHLNNQYGSKNLIYKYMQLEKEYLDEPLHFEFQFGGKSILKAVMKNLYNFLFWLQRDQSQVIDVNASDLKISREYIRYDINGNKFYSSLDFLNPTPYHLSDKDISHYISVFRKNKMIYGYFTLFGQITYTAILSENSEGDDFRYGFSINPITFEKSHNLELLDVNYNSEITLNYPVYAEQYFPIIKERIEIILKLSHSIIISDQIAKITNSVIDKYRDKGEKLTESEIREITASISKEFIRFVYRIPEAIRLEF